MLTKQSFIVNNHFEEINQLQINSNCFSVTASNNIPTPQAFVNTLS